MPVPRQLNSEEFQGGVKIPYSWNYTSSYTKRKLPPLGSLYSELLYSLPRAQETRGITMLQWKRYTNLSDLLDCNYNISEHVPPCSIIWGSIVWLSGLKKSNKHPQKLLAALFEVALMKHATTIQGNHPWASIVFNLNEAGPVDHWIYMGLSNWVTVNRSRHSKLLGTWKGWLPFQHGQQLSKSIKFLAHHVVVWNIPLAV